ncbi:MAG: GAF domain-containing sensor histidine kinase [Desulfohalobiaceae bacterium]
MQNTPEQREVIFQLAAALANSDLPLAAKVQKCLGIVREALGAETGALHLFPGGGKVLVIHEREIHPLRDYARTVPPGGVVSTALSRLEPVLIPSSSEAAIPGESQPEEDPGSRSLIGTPLLGEDRQTLVGVMHLAEKDRPSVFAAQDLDRLAAYSQWIAPFVADQLRNRSAPLEEGRNPSQPANNAPDPNRERDQAEELEFVVHDLKSPLAALITNLDVLYSLSHTNRQATMAQTALKSANKLYLRIKQVLDLLRLEDRVSNQAPLPPVDLGEIIDRQIHEHRPLLDRKAIEVHRSGPEGLRIPAEEALLNHLLQNLLSNAIRHTWSGGRIAFTWWTQNGEHGSETVVCIEDSGEGIAEDKKREIRQCMEEECKFLGKGSAGGLGFMICSRIIGILQGNHWIEDASPQGTRVCFTLPAPRDSA